LISCRFTLDRPFGHTPPATMYSRLILRSSSLLLHTAQGIMDHQQAKGTPNLSPRSTPKRCCALCRQRKTRCELPAAALSLPAGPVPLPPHHACHRCIVLSMDCVLLSPQSRRVKKDRPTAIRSVASSAGEQNGAQSPCEDSTSSMLAEMSRDHSPNLTPANHDLDILTTFELTGNGMVRAAQEVHLTIDG